MITSAIVIVLTISQVVPAIWNKEELPEDWKASNIVPTYKNSNKIECNN
jgi:hypothetical protein